VRPATSASVTTIAPALMNGLRGMPCSASSWTMELNREPDGSRPTRFHRSSPIRCSAMVRVKTLEIDWIENGIQASAELERLWPSTVITAMPKRLAVHPRQRRDVVGHVPRRRCGLHLLADLGDDAARSASKP
jgi:hypothetical protein